MNNVKSRSDKVLNNKKRSKYIIILAIIILIVSCIFFVVMMKKGDSITQNNSSFDTAYKVDAADLTETEITTEETYANTKYPLLAKLEEQDIFLYGIDTVDYRGVVLKHGDKIQVLDWTFMTPRFILPQLSTGDFDNDGDTEIACILDIASGTSVSVQELHILELMDDGSYKDNVFNANDYINQIEELVKYTADSDKITFNINGKETAFQFSDIMENGVFEKINYGSTVEYAIDDKIHIYVPIEFFFKDTVSPQYLPVFEAEVLYDNGFTLLNPIIE